MIQLQKVSISQKTKPKLSQYTLVILCPEPKYGLNIDLGFGNGMANDSLISNHLHLFKSILKAILNVLEFHSARELMGSRRDN